MEPVWLGISGASIASSLGNLAQRVSQPFSGVLSSVVDDQETASPSLPRVHDLGGKNPHTKLLAELLTGHPLVGDESVIDLAEIRTNAEELLRDLTDRIDQALRAAGIETEGELELRISPLDGSLEVSGSAPRAGEIELLLAKSPEFARDFRRLTAMESLLAAAEKESDFADAYEVDPYEAVAQFAELFTETPSANLLITPVATEIRFQP